MNMNMHLKVLIISLSFFSFTSSAFPLHRDPREAVWTDSKTNQAHDKTNLTKDKENLYKSHLDSSSLYDQADQDNGNPMAEEMQHKLNMESERLRARLRQELAELQERLSPSSSASSAHISSSVADVRERLLPLIQELHGSLSSSTQELGGQLSLYLQSLEAAEGRGDVGPSQKGEAVHWITRALEQSGSKLDDILRHFQTQAFGMLERLAEVGDGEGESDKSGLWQLMRSRVEKEVTSLRAEAQNRVEALKAEIAGVSEAEVSFKAEVTASVERFCRGTASLSQVFEERFFKGLEEELTEAQRSSTTSSSSSLQPAGSLQEDFSARLSVLIQDILHSV